MKKPNIDYVSVDIKSADAMLWMDITNIAFEDSCFDVIICNHVLEHISDDHRAMSELYRVLKPEGWAILQTPISLSLSETFEDRSVVTPERREKIFGQDDHVRIYAKDYKERLEKIGFCVSIHNIREELGYSTVCRYSLLEDESIYLVRK